MGETVSMSTIGWLCAADASRLILLLAGPVMVQAFTNQAKYAGWYDSEHRGLPCDRFISEPEAICVKYLVNDKALS